MKEMCLFALAMTFLVTFCGQKKEKDTAPARPAKVATVDSQSVIPKGFSGVVEAVKYVKPAFRVNGRIINLSVVGGQRVKKEQLIATIGPRDVSLQYAADKTAYKTAAAQVERNKRLLGRQAIFPQEYEISIASYQKAKSTYELSTDNIWDTKLLALLDGSIETRLVESYQCISSGEGIVRLVNTQKLRIKFTVPSDYFYLFRIKDVTFKIEFDIYKDTVFNARLGEYFDIPTDSIDVPVAIIIDDVAFGHTIYDAKPEFAYSIRLASDITPFIEEKLMNVSLSAVFGDDENKNTYVQIVKDNKVSRRGVTVYSLTREANLLTSKGLRPGKTVVITGVYQSVEGRRIKEVK